MRVLSLLAISLAAPAFALAFHQTASQPPPPPPPPPPAPTSGDVRTVTMTGEAVVKVAPDLATVVVRLKREAGSEAAARAAVNAATAKALQQFTDLGIAAADVQSDVTAAQAVRIERAVQRTATSATTGALSGATALLSSASTTTSSETERAVLWSATRRITICVRELARLTKLIDVAGAAAGVVESIVYDTSDLPALKERARQLAARAARGKATTLVEELGAHLGLPRTVGEGQYRWSGAYSWTNISETVPSEAVVTADIATGLLRVDASVNVVFDIIR